MNTSKVFFANSAESNLRAQTEMFVFGNEAVVLSDGWAHLAPFGDFHGTGVLRQRDGTVQEFEAIQRLDHAAASRMVAHFKSPWNTLKRYLTGVPIYHGHPDMANAGSKYPDKEPKGMIAGLECRADGLYCLPVFTNEGRDLLNQGKKLFFSGRWSSDPVGEENGLRVFRPAHLKSAGLTARPNLPVHHANDQDGQTATPNKMNRTQLLHALAAFGIQFANDADATDAALLDAITTLGHKAKSADTLATERDTFRAHFANERKLRIAGLLDGAIASGKITAAQRPDWETRLANEVNFANEAAALQALATAIKTQSLTMEMGGRKVEIANASGRRHTVASLVKTEMETARCDYDTAFARVQKTNPALFEAMKQPRSI
jgi:hypothetical protein